MSRWLQAGSTQRMKLFLPLADGKEHNSTYVSSLNALSKTQPKTKEQLLQNIWNRKLDNVAKTWFNWWKKNVNVYNFWLFYLFIVDNLNMAPKDG